MRTLCFALMLVTGLALFAGNTYYVDSKLDDYTGHDGSSWEKAFETIQEAINKAAASGDRIYVASGIYEGGKTFSSWGKARLSIVNKCLWIEGAGAEKTIVRGQHGSTANGLGTDTNDCCACVHFYGDPCKGTVLKGMTFCNGAPCETRTDPLGLAEGTGLYQESAIKCSGVYAPSHNREIYVVDCIVSNCLVATTSGVLSGITAVRTKIIDNHLGGPHNSPTLVAGVNLLHCLVAHNSTWKNGDGLTGGGKVVNCTFIDNYMTTQIGSSTTGYFYNSITYGKSTTVNASYADGNVIGSAVYSYPVMSLWTDDIRIRRQSGCAQVGDAKYVADTTIIPALPEGVDRFKDLWGNAIPEEGKICPGAVQQVADEVSGSIRLDGNTGLNFFRIDGGMEHYALSYHFPSNYPSQYAWSLSRATPSNQLLRVYTDITGTRYPNLYPDENGVVMMTPPPTVGTSLKLGDTRISSEVLWVDPAADAAVADGTEEKPYRTFKAALENIGAKTAYLLICAKPGVYAEGDMTVSHARVPAYKCRVFAHPSVEVRIVGVKGPEKTILKGAPDPATHGLGDDAVRVAVGRGLQILGCTLTGGYSDAADSALYATSNYCGWSSGLLSPDETCFLGHCIISNNYAVKNTAANYALLNRCLVVDNHALGASAGGILRACYLVSSVVGTNDIAASSGSSGFGYLYSGGENAMKTFNVTFFAGAADNLWNNGVIPRFNSVAVGGGTAYGQGDSFNNFFWNTLTIGSDMTGYAVRDPMYVAQAGETRVFAASPILFGATVCNAHADWYYLTTDFYGTRWRFSADGTYAAGAFQDTIAGGIYVTDDARGGFAVTEGAAGYRPLEGDDTVTVTLTAGATRPVAAYTKNGVTNQFLSTSVTVTAAEAAAAGGIALEPVYANAWYVDDDGSDTAHFGYNAATPFKTLKRALENAQLVRGDTVMVMPGVYAEGEMFQDKSCIIPARAVVRDGITLRATGTAEETIIRGCASDVPDEPNSGNEKYRDYAVGLGPNAVRCVYAEAGANVYGLTLDNGHTRAFTDSGDTSHGNDNYNGGNATGYGSFHRCILTNGKAFRGGGGLHAKFYDCTFAGNTSIYGGGATSDAYMYGCLSQGNDCLANASRKGFFFYVACENCTIADSDGGPAYLTTTLRNCLITGTCKGWVATGGTPGPTNFVHCAVVAENADATYRNVILGGAGCIVTNAAALTLDAEFRPVLGACAAIDAGDISVASAIGDTDLSGMQRVYNARLDIGALEADWRPKYARDIKRANVVVAAASSNVVETAEGTVALTGASALSATWCQRAGRKTVTVRVTGNGTLALARNGEIVGTFTALDGTATYAFKDQLTENRLDFSYTPGENDTGCAEILNAQLLTGTTLYCR